jgi:hypothetical protein
MIFHDFLRNLQNSANHMYYLRCGFAARVPEIFSAFTDTPSVYTKLPRQKLDNAIGSSAMASGGSATIPVSPAAGSAGEGGGND